MKNRIPKMKPYNKQKSYTVAHPKKAKTKTLDKSKSHTVHNTP
jgi:hypothetical protein